VEELAFLVQPQNLGGETVHLALEVRDPVGGQVGARARPTWESNTIARMGIIRTRMKTICQNMGRSYGCIPGNAIGNPPRLTAAAPPLGGSRATGRVPKGSPKRTDVG
jgi:hypothetical protein